MVTLSLVDDQPVADALVGELLRIGAAMGCSRLEVEASPMDRTARSAMAAHALQDDATLLRCSTGATRGG